MRGFSCVGLFRPKTGENVGSTLRAAHCYGCAFVAVEGARGSAIKHCTNTQAAHRHMPVFTPPDLLDVRPYGTQLVVIELIDGAEPLPLFQHPERAMYIFGPEDGSLGPRHTGKAKHVVYVPTRGCMNLAATVNVVLYDRALKRGRWQDRSAVEQGTENTGVAGSIPALVTT